MAVAVVAILAVPAFAQMNKGGGGSNPNDPRARDAAKAERDRAGVEKDYEETMKRLRTEPAAPRPDPWGKVRPATGSDSKR